MSHYTLSGAYGRDYNSKAAILKDWYADLDFIIHSGTDRPVPTNRADLIKLTTNLGKSIGVQFRFRKLTQIAVLADVAEAPKAPRKARAPKPVIVAFRRLVEFKFNDREASCRYVVATRPSCALALSGAKTMAKRWHQVIVSATIVEGADKGTTVAFNSVQALLSNLRCLDLERNTPRS